MQSLRLVIASLTAFCSMMTMVSVHAFTPASAFSDTAAPSVQYSTAINSLLVKGVLKGYPDGTFKPANRINRAEFLKIVMEAQGDKWTTGEPPMNCLADVKGEWFAPYVCHAITLGIVRGYPDGLFHPEREINFVEASKILSLAYKQSPQETGGEWYEGFVTALENSKAIPPSVAKLDAPLTRGEMAEMMWRLSEGKTDQPSKGLLNLKNPALSINTASDEVQYAASCAELEAFASAMPSGSGPNVYMRGEMMEDMAGAPAPAAMPSAANQKAGGSVDASHSQTNVQVEGVDEGDIVKTDSTFLYAVSRQKPVIRIIRAQPAGNMKVESTIDLQNDGISVSELYVDGGTLIVVGTTNGYWGGPMPMIKDGAQAKMIAPGYMPVSHSQTTVRIYDVSNAVSPKLTRTVSFDGNSVSTRRIGSKLYLVLQQPFYYYGDPRIMGAEGTPPPNLVPQFEDSKTGKVAHVAPCNRVAILPHIPSPEYMTVAVVPTEDLSKDVKTTVVLGNAQNVYASLSNLYVATPRYSYVWDSANPSSREQTHIYRFAFTDAGVELKAQGDVDGHILNQFSMDENGSTFRIATTQTDWQSGEQKSENDLFVLNMDLQQTGAVTGIAPGETIYSVRFAGNRAYMVTFKQIDPFFVIDLKDPRNPKILGNLKIPGFSNYLHPYGENYVIGFGKDADESIDADKVHSGDAIYYTAVQGLKMAMFDVTDVSNPKQKAVEIIGDRGSDSPLLSDHKALLFEPDRNLLSFPILVTKRPEGSLKSADGNPVFQGAYVYDISTNGFKLRGTITQYDNNDQFMKAGSYWYGGDRDIQRIVRIGNSLLTISDSQVKSNAETTVKEEGKLNLQ